MKARTIAYSIYMILSILVSLICSSAPSVFIFWSLFHTLDNTINSLGWPFSSIQQWFAASFVDSLPQIAFDKFWFLVLIIPIVLFCYGVFLLFLVIFFRLSRSVLPSLADGYYSHESEEWLIYEYFEVYYVIFPYFAWFFTVFLDTKPRHQLFGARIGKGTVVGNGRLFNPERTIIGDNCWFGYDAILSGHVYEGKRLYLKTVRLGNNVTVGANAVILAGADIGDNVIVGANTVVPKDRVIPPNTIWVHGKAIPRKVKVISEGQVVGGPRVVINKNDVPPEDEADIPDNGEHI